MKCILCDHEMGFRWTDAHGVAVCITCGLPYRLYHYEGDKRIEKPPSVAVTDEGVQLARAYWSEKKRMVLPGCFDMGFLGHRGTTYSGASREDCAAWDEWYEAAAALRPPQEPPR